MYISLMTIYTYPFYDYIDPVGLAVSLAVLPQCRSLAD